MKGVEKKNGNTWHGESSVQHGPYLLMKSAACKHRLNKLQPSGAPKKRERERKKTTHIHIFETMEKFQQKKKTKQKFSDGEICRQKQTEKSTFRRDVFRSADLKRR